LNEALAYQDDSDSQIYEIWQKPLSDEKLLAFEISAFRISSAWDSNIAFEEVEFTLELFASGWDGAMRIS